MNVYNPQILNNYEQAIMNVGSILLNYDNDKLVPVYGFGGIPSYSPTRQVSHCFSLNGTPDGVIAGGVEQILATY